MEEKVEVIEIFCANVNLCLRFFSFYQIKNSQRSSIGLGQLQLRSNDG